MRLGPVLRSADGSSISLAPSRWRGQPTLVEERILAEVAGPALDVGCGPGRHVLALARRGVLALGIDISPVAVSVARDRGADVLQACVFRPLPLQGAWRTVLLLDGNIGIGGCPATLLRRTGQLLAAGGRALVEVDPPGTSTGQMRVRVEHGAVRGPWFAWARVAASRLPHIAESAGLDVSAVWDSGGRWFARLDRHLEDGEHAHDAYRRHDGCVGCGSGTGTDDWAIALAEGACA
jgi:SAM-dependent methyltransferase